MSTSPDVIRQLARDRQADLRAVATSPPRTPRVRTGIADGLRSIARRIDPVV